MYLRELIDVAKAGAVLGHPVKSDCVWLQERLSVARHGSAVTMTNAVFDNFWYISKPAPGACPKCKGLGRVDISHLRLSDKEKIVIPNSLDEVYECPVCKGTGKLIEPEVPTLSVLREEKLDAALQRVEELETRLMNIGGGIVYNGKGD